MAGQQDLDVAHLEAERLDGFLDQGDGPLEAAVDEDVPLGSGDQVAGQVLRADVVDVADDLVGRERLVPVGLADGGPGQGQRDRGRREHARGLRSEEWGGFRPGRTRPDPALPSRHSSRSARPAQGAAHSLRWSVARRSWGPGPLLELTCAGHSRSGIGPAAGPGLEAGGGSPGRLEIRPRRRSNVRTVASSRAIAAVA